MKSAAASPEAAGLLSALEHVVEAAATPQLARLLGDLERLKATVWQRLLNVTTVPGALAATDAVEELRHLTPQQVAEILSLKAAYVHELCRTGRIPATKSGKYWMISAAGLRRWLAYQNRDVDGSVEIRLKSPVRPGDGEPRSRRSAAPRPSRALPGD
jgi:excisionase family DNA binding protein